MENSTKPIRLIVADIDGCFTQGGRFSIDLELCARVRAWNEASSSDPAVPALVFCTGRPLPYVLCMHQLTGSRLPSLAECGAVLWCPVTRRHHLHPSYTLEDQRHYAELRLHAEAELLGRDDRVVVEAGKFSQLTVYPLPPLTMPELVERVREFAARWHEHFTVDYTHAVINFLPHGINKGTGLEWLAGFCGVPADQMAGIGDSESDWDFMGRCRLSAAPVNGRPELREKVDWALESGPGACIAEVYERVIEWNRARATTAAAPTR
ncbi:HAD hydrolase family protein [Candidatus Poribacteria bacterium]|nr:HAD hydrolase family protein [Candidatus Poribacteria bacterium]